MIKFRKRAIICKVYFGSTHILFIWKRFFKKNPTVPETLGLDEMKFWWRRCWFWSDVTLSGWTCPFQKYIILPRSYFLIFFKNSGFIASNYRKSLILRGYDVHKSERLCIVESAFNLTREIGRWVMGEWPVWGSLGTSHYYTWAYDVNRFGKPCNLLTDLTHLVKVIVLFNLAD